MSTSASARMSSAGSPTRETRATSLTSWTRSCVSGCIRSPQGAGDVNDADRLRHDPTFQIVAADGRTTPGSQPTLSRLENAIEWPEIQRLARVGVDWFCAYAYGPDEHPADLVLDLDSTDDPTHGTQQLALFHGQYDQHMYHPLVWFEGRTGLLLRTRLRPGRDPSAACVVEDLQHLLPPLRRRFPHTPIFLRGDAGMATPRVEAKLEAEGIRYVLGIGTNRVFKARVAALVAKAQARYDRTGRPIYVRTSFRHRAKSWPHHRRILVKIDVTAQGLNVRFMVTNRRGRAADLVAWYDDRGASENWIKELKLDIHADRLSCHRFRANAFRLQLQSRPAAPHVLSARRATRRTRLATATIGTSGSSCSKSPAVSAAVSAGSGFISRPIGQANRSSPPVIARSPARQHNVGKRDIFSRQPTGTHTRVSAHALSPSFRGEDAPLNLSHACVAVSPLSIVAVIKGDGSASDSFVNNAG